jgi:hypothetical protein
MIFLLAKARLLRLALLSLLLMLIFPFCHQGEPGYIRQYITLAGKKMSYESFGLKTRLPGDPVLVFEAGSRGGVVNFSALFPALSKFTAGIAYDRNGKEESSAKNGYLGQFSAAPASHFRCDESYPDRELYSYDRQQPG